MEDSGSYHIATFYEDSEDIDVSSVTAKKEITTNQALDAIRGLLIDMNLDDYIFESVCRHTIGDVFDAGVVQNAKLSTKDIVNEPTLDELLDDEQILLLS